MYTVLRQKVEPLGNKGEGVTFQGLEKETEGPIYKLFRFFWLDQVRDLWG